VRVLLGPLSGQQGANHMTTHNTTRSQPASSKAASIPYTHSSFLPSFFLSYTLTRWSKSAPHAPALLHLLPGRQSPSRQEAGRGCAGVFGGGTANTYTPATSSLSPTSLRGRATTYVSQRGSQTWSNLEM
jgi:hypothetical protein